MRKSIKNIFWAVLVLAMSHQAALAFSFLGPRNATGGLDGDANWELPVIGHALPGDVGTVKNIGEEWRRVTPIMYYASDQSFLDFFGQVGTTNIDSAFAIMNGVMCGQTNASLFLSTPTNGILTSSINDPYTGVPVILAPTNNLNRYSLDLADFPLESQQINYTAQALNLTDLRSFTLSFLAEQMGLAEPERFAWTLHDRFLPSGGNCSRGDELYFVVQRNFDVIDSPFNQVQYSPYVNGVLYTYEISEACAGAFPATTVPIAVDIFADTYTAVASFGLLTGGFYTSLTRDDVAGLRYLISTNNINFEQTAPSGGLLLTTNILSPQIFGPTQPLTQLFADALVSDPGTLQTNYPGISFLSVGTNIVNQITTNISVYYTNQSVLPVFSNSATGMSLPVLTTLTNIYFFTNQPGPTVINYDTTSFLTITTLDLATFADASVTNDPATMQTLYPGLQILSFSAFPTVLYVTNFVSYLTNYTGAPFSSPPKAVTLPISTNSYIGTVYSYRFGNVFTNHSYASRPIRTRSVWLTNFTGAPFGSPPFTVTNDVVSFKPQVSGDIFIIPTNWCGFDFLLSTKPNVNPPYAFGPTNITVFQGYVQQGTTNVFGLTNEIADLYTNYYIAVRPGICEPVLGFGTNFTTNIVAHYNYYFNNIITNHYYSNTLVTLLTTNIFIKPGGSPGSPDDLVTNITSTNFYVGLPSGDFYIIPPTFCDFTILSTQLTSVVSSSSTITASNNTGVDLGQQFSQTTVVKFTNTTFQVQPSICGSVTSAPALRQGIGRVAFIRANYDSLLGRFFQPQTNDYTMVKVVNSQMVTEYYRRVVTTPDFLMEAQDLTTGPNDGVHGTGGAARSLTFDNRSTINPGLAGPGTIINPSVFTYEKVGTVYANGSQSLFLLATNAFLNQTTQGSFFGVSNGLPVFAWASFDYTTNDPVVYPNGASITDLYNQLYLQVTPTTVPDGTVGVAYTPVTFAATGGQQPYTWAMPSLSTLVPGMTFDPSTQTLSGTPTSPGTFSFTVRLTDAVNRVVNLSYSITIH